MEEIAPGLLLLVVPLIICVLALVLHRSPLVFDMVEKPVEPPRLSNAPVTRLVERSNPFIISLRNPQEADLSCGFEFEIRTKQDCEVYMLWGVHTNLLARITMGEGFFTSSYSTLEDMFIEQSMYHEGPIRLEKGTEGHRLFAQARGGFTLGPPPRHRVPLVFLTKLPDRDYSELELDEKDIVSLVTVVHIKDDHCVEMTSKLNEVLRLRNGNWIPLHKFYSTSTDTDQGLCAVCQSESVTRILLPCRHACLCDVCLTQLSSCPVCRSGVSSSAVI